MRAVVGVRVAVGVHREQQGLGQHPGVAHAVVVEHADRHDLRGWRHHGDQAGHMGAMAIAEAVRVEAFAGVVVEIDEIEARHEVTGQCRVRQVDAGVQHRHAHAGTLAEILRGTQAHGLGRPLRLVGHGVADDPGHVAPRLGAAVIDIGFGDQHIGLDRGQRGQHVLGRPYIGHQLEAIDGARAEAVHQRHRIALQQARQRRRAAQLHQDFQRHGAVARAAARTAADQGGARLVRTACGIGRSKAQGDGQRKRRTQDG
jgi:hypothetical protein